MQQMRQCAAVGHELYPPVRVGNSTLAGLAELSEKSQTRSLKRLSSQKWLEWRVNKSTWPFKLRCPFP
jgi:hypothetical protein